MVFNIYLNVVNLQFHSPEIQNMSSKMHAFEIS